MPKSATPIQIKEILKAERARVAKRNGGGGGGRIGSRLQGTLKRTGTLARQAGDLYGVTNPPVTILTGRNALNPSGNLATTARSNAKTLRIVNPFTDVEAQSNLVMLDSWGALTGSSVPFGGAPDTNFGTRLRAATRIVGYNARSSLTAGGGFATTWWPLVLGPIAGRVVRGGLNLTSDLVGGVAKALPAMRR